ncbi:hypothetical protein M911_04125 [Ectothiorhodospira haloalkaliphila]|uniref:Uncharacterized protein n=1 Tax=Ectothiorhodospira haloalkaliphila TaxID=421628 RepID=W8L9W1_9GAMM|nr:hypothetical protein M911_04125 [Ectothiorhodospira haloalkaliphila]
MSASPDRGVRAQHMARDQMTGDRAGDGDQAPYQQDPQHLADRADQQGHPETGEAQAQPIGLGQGMQPAQGVGKAQQPDGADHKEGRASRNQHEGQKLDGHQ